MLHPLKGFAFAFAHVQGQFPRRQLKRIFEFNFLRWKRRCCAGSPFSVSQFSVGVAVQLKSIGPKPNAKHGHRFVPWPLTHKSLVSSAIAPPFSFSISSHFIGQVPCGHPAELANWLCLAVEQVSTLFMLCFTLRCCSFLYAEKSVFKFQQFNILSLQIVVAKDYFLVCILISC